MTSSALRRSFQLLGLGALAVFQLAACSSTSEADSEEDADEGALSVPECNGQAEKVKASRMTTCETKKKESLAKVDQCYAAADVPVANFRTRAKAAGDALERLKSAEVDGCIATVQARLCGDLVPSLKEALKSTDRGVSAAAERSCVTTRQAELERCNSLAAFVDENADAAKAYRKEFGTMAWTRIFADKAFALASCWLGDSTNSEFGKCKSGAETASKVKFDSCRRACGTNDSTPPGGACVPDKYADKGVACGEMAKGFFSGACDCSAGAACQEYDKLIQKDGKSCTLETDSEYKIYVVRVGAEKATGKAVVRADCLPAKDVVGF